jgi:hypothetical protein
MTRSLRILGTLTIAVALAACGGGGNNDQGRTNAPGNEPAQVTPEGQQATPFGSGQIASQSPGDAGASGSAGASTAP